MFVEHMVRVLGAAHNLPAVFHTAHDPDTPVVVAEANRWFTSNGVLPGAREHTCKDCTHKKKYRINAIHQQAGRDPQERFGVAGVDEAPPNLPEEAEHEGNNGAEARAIDEDELPNEIEPPNGNEGPNQRVVRMAVLDGIVAGHSVS